MADVTEVDIPVVSDVVDVDGTWMKTAPLVVVGSAVDEPEVIEDDVEISLVVDAGMSVVDKSELNVDDVERSLVVEVTATEEDESDVIEDDKSEVVLAASKVVEDAESPVVDVVDELSPLLLETISAVSS